MDARSEIQRIKGKKRRRLGLKRDLDRVYNLFWGQAVLLGISLLMEFYYGFLGFFKLCFFLGFFLFFFKMSNKALRFLYYTYWTFSFFMGAYLLKGMVQYWGGPSPLFKIYLLALVFLSLQVYILSSPVFYPRVSWWEYDFRRREDWVVQVRPQGFSLEEELLEGRMTDLRRGAGCVVLFQDLKVGDELTIIKELWGVARRLTGEIKSKREYTLGRGFTYGVKFHLGTKDDQRLFEDFSQAWEKDKKEKSGLKFEGEGEGEGIG